MSNPKNITEKFPYIVIEGPIGSGKTTLARKLAERFPVNLLLEKAEANPFLSRFYEDQERYALPTQLFFLFQRANQIKDLTSSYHKLENLYSNLSNNFKDEQSKNIKLQSQCDTFGNYINEISNVANIQVAQLIDRVRILEASNRVTTDVQRNMVANLDPKELTSILINYYLLINYRNGMEFARYPRKRIRKYQK